jgi:hypothetical protein
MKKVTFLLATLLIGGLMLTGCKKDDPQPTPTPMPTPTTKTVVYKMDTSWYDQTSSSSITLSPCFHFTFSYKDANGTMVEVNDPTLPWTKEISVTTPFEAKLEGKVTYNENELPEEGKVYFGALGTINVNHNTTTTPNLKEFHNKQQFLEFLSNHPDMLNFSFTLSVN